MDFTEEQMVAIGQMIASKVDEQTTALNTQLETLRTNNQALVNEKRQRTTDAEQERARADEAERQRLEASGDLDGFRSRVKSLEDRLAEREEEIKKSNFDRAITDAVASKNIRSELRDLLTDSLKLNGKYDAATGTTTVKGLTVEQHIDEILNSEAGKFYLPANGNTGGNAPGSTSSAQGIQMTKENFDGDKFFSFPQAERDVWAARHRPDLVGVK